MILQFTESAVRDLDRHRRFIAEHNPQAANRIAKNLKNRLQMLRRQPRLGHPVEGIESVREFVIDDYVCQYVLTGQGVIVLRVWHGREER